METKICDSLRNSSGDGGCGLSGMRGGRDTGVLVQQLKDALRGGHGGLQDAQKMQVEVIAIDPVEKPSANYTGRWLSKRLIPGELIKIDAHVACQVTVLDPAGQKNAFWQAPITLAP